MKREIFAKPTTFDGKSCFLEYWGQFRIIAQSNSWSEGKQFEMLYSLLTGEAVKEANQISAQNLKSLVEGLTNSFSP